MILDELRGLLYYVEFSGKVFIYIFPNMVMDI